MKFTYLEGYGQHIFWQQAKSVFFLSLIIALFFGIPEIVRAEYQYFYGPNGHPWAGALSYWPWVYYLGTVIGTVWSFETAARHYLKHRVTRLEYGREYDMLERLAQRANIRTPALVIARGSLNAAATRSLWRVLTGKGVGMVILMGSVRKLTDEQLEAVIAHEVGHLKHWDVAVSWIKDMVATVLSVHRAVFTVTGIWIALVWYWSSGTTAQDVRFAITLVATLEALRFVFVLLITAHSRAREYLADIAAVKLVDHPDGALHFSTALHRIANRTIALRGLIFEILDKDPYATHSSIMDMHPSIPERMQALGVSHEDVRRRGRRFTAYSIFSRY